MTRYIEADELAEKAWRVGVRTREDLIDFIKTSPTIDAVEVVRCKDCQHFKKAYGWNGCEYTECDHFDCDIAEDGFCSWGERREDAEVD